MDNDRKHHEQQVHIPPSHRRAGMSASPGHDQEEAAAENRLAAEPGERTKTSSLDALQAFFNFVLMVTAVIGSIVIYRQLDLMEEQMADTRRASKEQDKITARTLAALENQSASSRILADANKAMADAATLSVATSARIAAANERTVDIASGSNELEQRAWLGVKGVNGAGAVGEQWMVTVTFYNTGKTPARNLLLESGVMLVEGDEDFTDVEYSETTERHSIMVVPPGADVVAYVPLSRDGSPIEVSNELLTAVLADKQRVYVVGRVWYDDIFGDEHWLTYCYYWIPTAGGYGACQNYNEIDRPSRHKRR